MSETYNLDDKPKLRQAIESTVPTLLFNGPWGSGKTRLLAEKAYWLCRRWPKYKAALVRKDLKHLKRTTWKSLVEEAIPEKVLRICHYNKQELEIRLPNGSELHGCGLDDPQKLGSTEYGFIALEEATEIQDELSFTWIEGRARQPGAPFHQVMYACNAGPPSHYLYQHFFIERPKDRDGNPLTDVIQGEILWDILPASYRARLEMLKGKDRDRFVLNKWVGYEGLIYDCFNPTEHIKPRFKIPDTWKYVIAIDFGFNNPFVCQFWAVSPDDVWYLDKEIYFSHRTINQHSPTIRSLMEERNLIRGPGNVRDNGNEPRMRQFAIFSDHDSEDQATLEEHGIVTVNADKAVSSGIQKTYEMMNTNRIIFLEDSLVERDPILDMDKRPACTTDEIQGYIWMNNQKDQPRKVNDHGCDAMRYGIFSDANKTMPGLFITGRKTPVDIPEAMAKSAGVFTQAAERRRERWLRGD